MNNVSLDMSGASAHVEREFRKPFAARFMTLRSLDVRSGDAFCAQSAVVNEFARAQVKRLLKPLVFKQYRARAVGGKQQKSTASLHSACGVLLEHERQRNVREWTTQALTLLVYSLYVRDSPYTALGDAPMALMVVWLRDVRVRIAAAIDAGNCDVSDVSLPFLRALVRRHMLVLPCSLETDPSRLLAASMRAGSKRMTLEQFAKFAVAKPRAAAKQMREASRVRVMIAVNAEDIASDTEGALLGYFDRCCDEMAFFASGMHNIRDRVNLSTENLRVLWRCYLFVMHQRSGMRTTENPYSDHVLQQKDMLVQYGPLRQSLLALSTRIDDCLAEWRRESLLFCPPILRDVWHQRFTCLLQGLDSAEFCHRMLRQKFAQQMAFGAVLKIRGNDALSDEEKRRLRADIGIVLTADGKVRKLCNVDDAAKRGQALTE